MRVSDRIDPKITIPKNEMININNILFEAMVQDRLTIMRLYAQNVNIN